jgi:putative FmdB family regulatory protein
MALYEYFCAPCENKFELMRPMSQSSANAVCATCGGDSHRALSVFAAITPGGGFADDAACFGGAGGGDFACGREGGCACAE